MPKIDMLIDMMLRWTTLAAALAAVLLTTVIYAGPCQSQTYTEAAHEKPQGLWVVNAQFFDEFQGKSLQKSGSPSATFALTFGECCPSFPDLTFDQAGNLWIAFIAELGVGVGELTRDELNPSKRVFRFHVELSLVASGAADPFLYPSTLAFDPAGDLWVAGTAPTNTLIEFTPDQLATSGNPTPASTINFSGDSTVGPSQIQFDSAGDLWIAEETLVSDDSEAAIEYTPTQITEMQMGGSPTPILTVLAGSGFFGISAITFDKSGNLWMAVPNPGIGANGVAGGIVEMFNVAGKTGTLSQPNVVITPAAISPINQSLDRPSGLAFDNQGGLWVSSNLSSDQISGSRNSTGFIVKFAANQLGASGSPVPPIVLTPNHKASNLYHPSPIIFGPTAK